MQLVSIKKIRLKINPMKRIISNLLKNSLGNKSMQGLYEDLFDLLLKGMNYGNGGDFNTSGELNLLKHVKERLTGEPTLTLFDVGANDGNYSKTLANFFDNNAAIHSFEPSKKTFDSFLQTTSAIQNIIPNNFGFGDAESTLTLYTNKEVSHLASVYQRNLSHKGILMDKVEKIEISTIDNYCTKSNIDRIHFLKLDIEGHELKALKGAEHMLNNRKIDFIQFEFGGCNIDSRTYFQDFYYLLKDNYRIYRILRNGLYEIKEYRESNEIFIAMNYLAEKIE
jgi:FkbM family methyltransferase